MLAKKPTKKAFNTLTKKRISDKEADKLLKMGNRKPFSILK